VTASVATAYRTASRKNGTLSEALHAAHDEVRSVCRGEFMMTLAALSVSPHTATVSFHSAACPPALVVKTDGRVTTLGKKGSPLGAEAFNVGTDDYELQDGERIFLCSDGVLEMELKNGRPFGLRRAAKMLEGTARLPFPQALAHVEKELRALTLDVKQDDDITFVLIERAAGAPRA
jgi:serine phosphatase RsbU (regulator of sigma subunit)